MSNGTLPTPEQNAQQIAANTQAIAALNQAVNVLVSEFIRPNAQQHLQSLERLERIENIIEAMATQQQANTQQIAANAEAITRYDQRLEETRQLVAENGSRIAQLTVKQERNADQIAQLTVKQNRNADQISELRVLQQESTEQLNRKLDRLSGEVQAVAEATRTQLAAIIGNGRRIDRLEQQAS